MRILLLSFLSYLFVGDMPKTYLFHFIQFIYFRLDAPVAEETAMSIVLKGMKSVYFAMVMDIKS